MRDFQLWLVRHGATEWSQTKRHTGLTDIPLLPEGEQMARDLKPRLAGEVFELVLSSPLQRAWKTAELAGFEPSAEPLAVEYDYGQFEGLTRVQINEQAPGYSAWSTVMPGGETLDQLAARADEVIARFERSDIVQGLLFSHAHFLRALACRWIGQPVTLGEHLHLDPATICVLDEDRGSRIIRLWNA